MCGLLGDGETASRKAVRSRNGPAQSENCRDVKEWKGQDKGDIDTGEADRRFKKCPGMFMRQRVSTWLACSSSPCDDARPHARGTRNR